MTRKFAEQLRAARLAAGINQTQLAAALETDQARISDWERGQAIPTKAARLGIMAALKNLKIKN